MKEFLQSIFKATEERIKNPFIGAFMTSWFFFNWKPIVFLIFSSKTIEDKITYIDSSFSDICFVLWFPFCSAIFYVLILPYLNLLIEELLKYSSIQRNLILINKQKQTIENQKQLAIEEIKLEEAKTDFRERDTHNKLVDDLQKNIKDLEIKSEEEKKRNSELLNQLKSELVNRDKIASTEIKSFEKRYSESRSHMMELNESLFQKERQIQELNSILNNENLKFKDENTNVIRFENGLRIVERFEGSRRYFYNYETNKRYSDSEVEELMKKYNYKK